MATVLLIHGGWHGGWCWRWVAPRLRAAGHEVVTPTLTGLGDRAHLVGALGDSIDLDTHVRDVVELLGYDDLDRVVAVGHSYGGMVLTGVADRAPARLAHLVYLDAFLPADGQALFDLLRPERREALTEAARQHGGGRLVPPPPPAMLGVTDEERAAWLAVRLTPQPLRTFTQPLRLTVPAPASPPRSYVHCTEGAMALSFAPSSSACAENPAGARASSPPATTPWSPSPSRWPG
jgi:pimeloyl-ACP methyl ester carboxylesterase